MKIGYLFVVCALLLIGYLVSGFVPHDPITDATPSDDIVWSNAAVKVVVISWGCSILAVLVGAFGIYSKRAEEHPAMDELRSLSLAGANFSGKEGLSILGAVDLSTGDEEQRRQVRESSRRYGKSADGVPESYRLRCDELMALDRELTFSECMEIDPKCDADIIRNLHRANKAVLKGGSGV